jgi:gas vesicle protein
MMARGSTPEVVYVEREGDSSAKWLFWGALLGAGIALLYAPRSGEETRRNLQRKLWKFRAMTEEKLDEFTQQLSGRRREAAADTEEINEEDLEEGLEGEPAPPLRGASLTARQELDRRLSDARARRRAATTELEEPLA